MAHSPWSRLIAALAALVVLVSALTVVAAAPRTASEVFVPASSAASPSAAVHPSTAYLVTFSESGLPAGLTWQVKVGPQQGIYSPTDGLTDTLTFTFANGNYAYTITDISGWHQTNLSYTGTVVVNGAPVTEPLLEYFQVTYPVVFSESGLPPGVTFNVSVNGTPELLTTDGGTDALTFELPNGTFPYAIADISGWHQSTLPYSGDVVVSGAGVTERTLAYVEVTYSVGFSERMLPSGLTWQVTLAGTPKSLTTNGATDSLTWTGVANGTYPYSVTDIPSWHQSTLPYVSNLTVAGSSVTEPTLVYAQVSYAVQFSESGLPASLTWTVKVGAATESLVTDGGTDALTFQDGNGTFGYVITDVSGWHQSTLAYVGSVGVNGASVTEATLVYTQVVYTVTFDESGLPAGTNWSVNLSGTLANSTTPSIPFTEPNGTYGYALGLVPGYHSTTETGTVVVTGPGRVVDLVFVVTTYAVTFTESGLPSGTSWSVALVGTAHTSKTTTISFTEPNGTYSYTIGLVAGYVPLTRSSTVTVDGTSVNVPVPFVIVKYTVTFTELGLPTKKTSAWTTALGGTLQRSSAASHVFDVPNGTYTYLVAGPSGWQVSVLAPEGTLTVNGANVTQDVQLLKGGTTTISFKELGLAASSSWCVTVGWTACTTKTSLSFKNLTPGEYDYVVGRLPGFTMVVTLGKVYEGVNGSVIVPPAPTYTVKFTFPVTFTESGLTPGTSWTVSAGGFTNSSTTDRIVLDLVNGTYGFSVHKVTSYLISPSSGHFLVSGAPVALTVHFVQKGSVPRDMAAGVTALNVVRRLVRTMLYLL